MKVVLDNIIYSLQKSGGISVLWTELIENLMKEKDIEVSFLEYGGANNNLYRKNFTIQKDAVLNEGKQLKLNRINRYQSPNVNINTKFIFCSSYYRTVKNKNAINITIVHDFTYEYFTKGIAKWVHSLQKKRAIEKADGVICISENTKKDLLHFYPHINKDKIVVIHNGVSDVFFRMKEKPVLELEDARLRKLSHKKILVFVGHRTSYKNFDQVIYSYAKLNRFKDFHLLIVGETFTTKEQKMVDSILEKSTYTVLSRISNEMLNTVYNCSFALLYPSSYEGFGIPVVEAMKTGLPVITTKFSSLPEVGGSAVIYLDEVCPENLVKAINKLEDQDFRDDLIFKGIEQAKKFSWKATMKQYAEYFRYLYNKNNL